SSARIARGKTARSSGSTAPCKPSGPTGASSPRTKTASPPLHPGSSTTTLDDATQPSEASPRSADCNQRDGRVHLGRVRRQQLRAGALGGVGNVRVQLSLRVVDVRAFAELLVERS